MSFFSRLLGKDEPVHRSQHVRVPNEHAMGKVMDNARKKNIEALNSLSDIADRQVQDAAMVRQVVRDLVNRANQQVPKSGKAVG